MSVIAIQEFARDIVRRADRSRTQHVQPIKHWDLLLRRRKKLRIRARLTWGDLFTAYVSTGIANAELVLACEGVTREEV